MNGPVLVIGGCTISFAGIFGVLKFVHAVLPVSLPGVF
jgi:hypothetical protein